MAKDRKKKQVIAETPPELTITPELQAKVDELIKATHKEIDSYWDPKDTNEIYVPVDGGEIRVLHVKPEKPKNKRPIIHIPGWGVTKLGFNDLYEALHEDIEFYYLETREKGTSKIKRRKANMTIEQKAKDIAQVIEHLGLAETDYIIFAACWAATILLVGLKAKFIKIPTLAVIDPMHKLWFSRFWIKASPFIPTFLIEIFKTIIGFFVFLGMKEKTQLERNKAFVKNAVIWKWKRAAYKVKDLEMYGRLGEIKEEILVFNGTADRVHEQAHYPRMAKELPNGRFFFMNTDESVRERLQAVIMRELALVDAKINIPPSLLQFEKELKREEKENK